MSTVKKCSFYQDSQSLTVSRGYCNLIGSQTICGGTIEFCENPETLKKRCWEEKSKEESNHKRKDGHQRNLSNYKVLVVDDEEPMRKMMSTLLLKIGHQCITASNGLEALNKLNQNKVDAVVTDIVMPEMDGITFAKEILVRYPNLPVMVMTGHRKEYSAQSAISAGARDFIEKPFSMDEFVLRLNKMMHDYEILCQLEVKQTEMVFQLNKKSSEEINKLKREIESLKSKLYSVSG
jgi:DNA-binding NtrC family response regulator